MIPRAKEDSIIQITNLGMRRVMRIRDNKAFLPLPREGSNSAVFRAEWRAAVDLKGEHIPSTDSRHWPCEWAKGERGGLRRQALRLADLKNCLVLQMWSKNKRALGSEEAIQTSILGVPTTTAMDHQSMTPSPAPNKSQFLTPFKMPKLNHKFGGQECEIPGGPG